MLKTVSESRAEKTRGIAVTYRAGRGDKYGTCPTSCPMMAEGACGSKKIDADYFAALLDAVPVKGQAFAFSHFSWHLWADKLAPGKTVVNFSTESLTSAAAASRAVPTVVVVPETDWNGKKTIEAPLFGGPTGPGGEMTLSRTVRVVRCPAEYRKGFGCRECGSGDPLCARLERDFIIGFTAHGPAKRLAADPDQPGGCYADQGNCRIHWDATAGQDDEETDGDKLMRFAKSLPPRSILRHHVAGDIGAEVAQ